VVDTVRRFKANVFRALSHPTRIAVVESLLDGELTVGELSEMLGVEQTNASQHLAVLRHSHIVETRKAGNQIHYRLCAPRFAKLMAELCEFFIDHTSARLHALGGRADTRVQRERKTGA
jgi:DNA-binding transcriptional ArsR family regulator